ncbi:ABC transporter substrate-binding protein [Marinitenerispora sediminis]|nr:ABC transporter substrate-binding protein [Marinitenerispora sediminis]
MPVSRSPHVRTGSAVVLLSAVLTACAGSPTAEAPADGTLTFAVDVGPDCYDPHVSPADITAALQRNVYDSLVAQRPDGTVEPWLARSWEVSEDGTRYTFHLREDVTFHDGTPFDAEAVKINLDRIADPETGSQYAAQLIEPYASSEVLDDHTVEVELTEPHAPFLQALSTTYLGFHSPASIEEYGTDLCNGGPRHVGTGPFTFTGFTEGQQAVLTRNDDYDWAPPTARHTGPAHLEELVIRFIPENSVRTGALTSGEVDVIDQVPAADITTLETAGGARIVRQDSPGAGYTYFFNTTRPPFDDRRARLAVRAALDLDQITETLYSGQYDRAWSPLTPATFGYDEGLEGGWSHDPAEAGRLLDELGYTGRDGQGYRTRGGERFSIELLYDPTYQREDRITYDTAVQDQLRQAGIELRITPLGDGSYVPTRDDGEYDIIAFSWGRADPDMLRTLYHSGQQLADGGANASRLSDPRIDAWLETGLTESDPEARAAAYAQVQRRVVEEGYALPAFVQPRVIAAAPAVQGLAFDPSAWPVFYDVRLGEGGSE